MIYRLTIGTYINIVVLKFPDAIQHVFKFQARPLFLDLWPGGISAGEGKDLLVFLFCSKTNEADNFPPTKLTNSPYDQQL